MAAHGSKDDCHTKLSPFSNRMRRYMEDSVELTVREMVEREFGSNKIAIHLDWIKECLEKCDLISVFDLDSKTGVKEIDVIMLQALLKGIKKTF